MDHVVKPSGLKGVILKVAADQTLFAPTFLVIFLSSMGTLNGESIQMISDRIKRDFSEILITNWKVGFENVIDLKEKFFIFNMLPPGMAPCSNGEFLFYPTPT